MLQCMQLNRQRACESTACCAALLKAADIGSAVHARMQEVSSHAVLVGCLSHLDSSASSSFCMRLELACTPASQPELRSMATCARSETKAPWMPSSLPCTVQHAKLLNTASAAYGQGPQELDYRPVLTHSQAELCNNKTHLKPLHTFLQWLLFV